MTTVVAYSYDMDGCVFIRDHVYDPRVIIEEHEKLFGPAKSQPHKKYVYCGSARQTHYHDYQNAQHYKGPLATTMVSAIAQHLEAIHNTFLFGDIATYLASDNDFKPTYNIHSPGTHYQKRHEDLSNDSKSFLDINKVALIYSQIANLLIHEPDADEIIFNFYDDREDILKAINGFFEKYPQLLSKKVTLNLWHYSDLDNVYEPKLSYTLKGSCEKPHNNYYEVVKKMIETGMITHKFYVSYQQYLLILRADVIDQKYIDELVDLGTNGASSHHPGDGLIDHRATCSQKPVLYAQNNNESLAVDQVKTEPPLTQNERDTFWFF